MSRNRFKLFISLAIAAMLLLTALLSVRWLAGFIASFQQGADPAAALNIVPNVPLDWPVDLTWRADDPDTGREMEPFTRTQIEAAYIRAWLQWTFSYQKGEPHGLKTYFVGPALAAVTSAVEQAAADGMMVDQVATAHDLQLHFYSADGSIVAFTDHGARVAHVAHNADGGAVHQSETVAEYAVVMFLEDGNWRVRHWQRQQEKASLAPTAAPLTQQIVGINYYPQATPWDLFWTDYDEAVIEADLERITGLGLNAVRIFLPYEQLGADEISAEDLTLITTFLDQAAAQDLGVIATLFDFRSDYAMLTWPKADRHLEQVVMTLRDHPALLAWDIKNEPDSDYESNGAALVEAWLQHAIQLTRQLDPNTPITIGWATPFAASALADEVDFVTFHYYDYADKFADIYQQLASAVGDKPLVLGEFGVPTWNSYFFPNGHTEAEQARYYADILSILREQESAGYLAWTLYDFTAVPSTVAGRAPWRKGPQRHLGLFDAVGEPKLASELVGISADLSNAPAPAAWQRFTKPFWRTVTILCITSAGTLLWHLRRRQAASLK